MKGYHQRLLIVDVSRQTFEIETLSEELLRTCIGGKGLAVHLLLRCNRPRVDPLGPDNHLIFAVGPTAGTTIWGSCRHGVFCKSPLTGFLSESYSGGTVAEYMSRAGFDAVMIRGTGSQPIWIEVAENGAVFHPAKDLWGQETYATEDRVKAWVREKRSETNRCGVVCIGPAGENRVAFAVVENDYWRSAGRTGVGAVMGSKKIKAIVFRGNRSKQTADPEAIKGCASSLAQHARESGVASAYRSMGTPMLVDITNAAGCFPTRYWKKGRADHVDKINAAALHERLDVTPHACMKCMMACGRLATVKQGRHQGLRIEGPEYETIYAFGGLCEVDSIEEIAYLNDICDRLGLDTITAGNLAALTIEAVAQRRIDEKIGYGDVDGIARLLAKIAYREGIGDLLAEGIRTVASSWGMSDQAIHVKGMEPAGYDPRLLKGMGLAYATSDRGACHLRTTFYKAELSGLIDPERIEGKSEMLVEWEDRLTFFDTLVLCRFYRDLYPWQRLATILEAATGWTLDIKELRAIAADVNDNARRFNLKEGLQPADDRLPRRFFQQPLPETGQVITRQQFERLLRQYYLARGWSPQGMPPGWPDAGPIAGGGNS
ncbi:MAG: aldehyde:ferredoxin oxidoreductase [Deltaproteobacteria bacterium SG8_13]|nr:MAG: aldehyde:ferredoxin oxidoreductase [Deltaproteobacteria bacterium SG8_13]